jgi:Zn ribbon nucleic-acid-binding protein
MPPLGNSVRCAHCMSANVLLKQTPSNSGVNLEVVECEDCGYPKVKKPKKDKPSIKAVEDTTDPLNEYPEVN